MIALIKLDDYRIYLTKEEWDADPYSAAGYKREYAAHNYKQGVRQYRGCIERYAFEPCRFPCLMIQGATVHNPNGPDEIQNTFFYNFDLIDD